MTKVWVLFDENHEVITFFNTLAESFIFFDLNPQYSERYYTTNDYTMERITIDELNTVLEQ